MRHEHNISWSSTKNSGMLFWRHFSQESQQKQPSRRPENRVQHHAGSLTENELNQIILKSVEWRVPWIHSYIQRNSSWPQQNWGNSGHVTPKDPQRAQRFTRKTSLYPKTHRKSVMLFPTIYTTNEETRLLRMGWSLPNDFWRYQRISHQAPGPGGSRFEKIIHALCTIYEPLFECLLVEKNDEGCE